MTTSDRDAVRFDESIAAARVAGASLPDPAVSAKRYQAAQEIFASTGAMDLVLDGLTWTRAAHAEMLRSVRRTLIYLVILLLVASVLLGFFNEVIVIQILRMREDMKLVPAVAAQHANTTQWIPFLIMVLVGTAIALVVLLASGGASAVALCFGGGRYRRNLETGIALKVVDRLIQAPWPAQQATTMACDLVDASPAIREQLAMLSGDRVRPYRGTGPSGLRRLADDFQSIAADQLVTMRTMSGMLLVPIIGGTAVMAYCIAVFWPIIALMKDLTLPGINT